MPTLQEIEHEILNVLEVSDELDVETLPAVQEYLDDLALQEAEKVDAVSYAVRKRQAEIEFLKDEEKRIRIMRQARERRMAEFKDYLRGLMQHFGLQKVKGQKATMWLRETESVEIDDLNAIPDDLKETRIEVKPDKKRIKDMLKNGGCPGAHLEKNLSLNIR